MPGDRRRGNVTSQLRSPQREALTASSQILDTYNTQTLVVAPNEWQREAWGYYHSLGELNFGIGSWLSNAISRVRLIAAQRVPGSDDPTPVTDGPVAQLVAGMAGGLFGQTAMLKRMAVQVSVPGDSYLVTEEDPFTGRQTSTTYSNAEIRITSRNPLTYQINTQRNLWRPLAKESLVSRVWWPDEEYAWRATSPVEAALPILREIDMYNRYVIAVLLSRVASNGMLLIPDGVTFPVKPEFKDSADPFMAELIATASRAIKNPGSAAAALPMPVKMPAHLIENVKHLTFATQMGEKVFQDRQMAIDRLAVSLNMPPEAMKGMGDTNHWGAWQISEDAVKLHISPPVEVIVDSLTQTFLAPMAAAAGIPLQLADGSEYIIWYDASALIQQPDRSQEAIKLHDIGEISGKTLRRETGLDEDDKPSTAELRYQVLLKLALSGGPESMAAASVLLNDPSLAEIPQRVTITAPASDSPPITDPGATPAPAPATNAPPAQPTDTNPAPPAVGQPARS